MPLIRKNKHLPLGALYIISIFFASSAWAQVDPENPVIFGNRSAFNPYGTYILSGKVIDRDTDQPISQATVYLSNGSRGAISQKDGSFLIKLPPGKYTLKVSYLGLDPVEQKIEVYADGNLTFPISLQALEMDEVILEAEASDANVKDVITGIEKLNIDEINNLPAFLGEVDVVKSLLLLPGVSTVGEGANGFNVRGGRVDQNLVMLDGALLVNPSHMLGFFSAFHPDIVENFTLYKGHIPAQFGGRASSVLDIKGRDGNFSDYKIKGGMGLVASRLVLEGPIVKDKTSLIIGGRASYANWLLRQVKDFKVANSSARFYDGSAKLTHRIGENHRLSLSYYRSEDSFSFFDEFGFDWRTELFSFNWRGIFSERLLATFSATYGDYVSSQNEPTGIDGAKLENGLNYIQAKQNFLYKPNEVHKINVGAEMVINQAKPEVKSPFDERSVIRREEVEKDNGREFALYLNDEITLSQRISISLGVRYSFYQQIGEATEYSYLSDAPRRFGNITDSTVYAPGEVISTYGGWEPRLSFRFQLGTDNSIKFSYNRIRQYIHQISNTTSATPLDFWQVSNRFLPPQLVDNYSIGYFHNFNNNSWELSAELYFKDMQNLVEYKDFADLYVNRQIETQLITGKGQAYGIETAVRKELGRWTGWMSYTYSRSLLQVEGAFDEETINNGTWYPSNFDQPHSFTLSATRKLGKAGAFSSNVVYNTGRPFTALIGSYEANGTTIPHFSDRNAFRIPAYFRVDISFTVGDIFKKIDDNLTFSIYNLFSRNNAYSVFYKRDGNSFIPNAFKLSVLGAAFPSLTYNFSF